MKIIAGSMEEAVRLYEAMKQSGNVSRETLEENAGNAGNVSRETMEENGNAH